MRASIFKGMSRLPYYVRIFGRYRKLQAIARTVPCARLSAIRHDTKICELLHVRVPSTDITGARGCGYQGSIDDLNVERRSGERGSEPRIAEIAANGQRTGALLLPGVRHLTLPSDWMGGGAVLEEAHGQSATTSPSAGSTPAPISSYSTLGPTRPCPVRSDPGTELPPRAWCAPNAVTLDADVGRESCLWRWPHSTVGRLPGKALAILLR